jgi:hypothetical protein
MTRLPAELHTVLATLVDSLEKVELVWLLSNARGPMPLAELERRAQFDDNIFRETVDDLVRSKVVRNGGASIGLALRAQTDDLQALMRVYAEDRIAIMEALMSISIDRIRVMAAHTFANAFVLRKKKQQKA